MYKNDHWPILHVYQIHYPAVMLNFCDICLSLSDCLSVTYRGVFVGGGACACPLPHSADSNFIWNAIESLYFSGKFIPHYAGEWWCYSKIYKVKGQGHYSNEIIGA